MSDDPAYAVEYNLLHEYASGPCDDRVVVITSAAYCERYILDLLSARLPAMSEELSKKLFAENRPLHSASARFDLAEAIGLISGEFRREMRVFFKIRNLFAHNLEIRDANDERICGLTNSLTLSLNKDEKLKEEYRSWPQSGRLHWHSLFYAGQFLSQLNLERDLGRLSCK